MGIPAGHTCGQAHVTNAWEDVLEGVVLVDGRGAARTLQSLAMKCDGKEIPELGSGARPLGWWIIANCLFQGKAVTGGEKEQPGSEIDATITGPAAIAVGDGRMIGILAPPSNAEPALWWSWALSSLTVETSGAQGLLKKRPAEIRIRAATGTLDLKDVSRLYRNSGSFQNGQERSLLKVLGH